ncbi:MAG: DUF3990 domain-containing protein [Lachnospiraceae bacterium]|nr:DUF3990 domain-containing protein [Lachnospiraceae bacterium]
MILYHGSPNKEFAPEYGKGEDKHDYGRGFYLTQDKELAKEWAVCNPNSGNGWVHKYDLDCSKLKIFDFEQAGILTWLAELMKHRAADNSRRYKILSEKFIIRYGVETSAYDVIRGWRANASYFYIAKAFVRDEIDVCILEELFHIGDLGIQYCLKSEKAFGALAEDMQSLEVVDYRTFHEQFNLRDQAARRAMKELIDSEKNKVTDVFSTLL